MNTLTPILTITGSDNTGGTGIQQDIKTISAMGGHALTAITSITIQDDKHIKRIFDLPFHVVLRQVQSIISTQHPKAIKMGMIRDVETIIELSKEVEHCDNLIIVPGILSSKGEYLMSMEAIHAWKTFLIPKAKLLIIKCDEAEKVLDMSIKTSDAMVKAARKFSAMGAKGIMLRGGHVKDNSVTALLYYDGFKQFYTSLNMAGWQRHGVGAAMSAAIATRLALGDSLSSAVHIAHKYMHTQVVYDVTSDEKITVRPVDLYNVFMDILADNFKEHHEVSFYANKMNIGTRYLGSITNKVVEKSPKLIITEYLMQEAKQMLQTTFRSVQEISYDLGFKTQSQFTKAFIQIYGTPPSEFRKQV